MAAPNNRRVVLKRASLGTTSLLAGAALTGIALSYLYRRSKDNNGGDDRLTHHVQPTADADAYRKAKLISARNAGAGAKVLKFRLDHGQTLSPLKPFVHVQVKGVSMDVPPEYPFGLKVEQPYTPITAAKTDFEILVKNYPVDAKTHEKNFRKGITSRYLLGLQPGQTVDVKGTLVTCDDEVLRDAVMARKFVGLVCGGSGITPALQLLSRLTSADSARRFSILWSNRSLDDMFFKKELEGITKSMKNVNLRYTLTRMAPPGWLHDMGRVSKDLLRARMPPPSPDTIIVVCGPDSFVEAVAGGKKGSDGKWRGPIGGFLKDLNYTSEHVIRL